MNMTGSTPRAAQQQGAKLIIVTRLNGSSMSLNCDLIERAESTPDTVLTLTDGTKFVITESVDEVVAKIQMFRASVIALAGTLEVQAVSTPKLHVVPNPPTED
jgi:flagellar protein FlbD